MQGHFALLESDRDLTTAIEAHYELHTVLLSILVAILSSYAAFLISGRIRQTDTAKKNLTWLIIGAFALGGGIWAMHFIGMLAYKLQMTFNYDVVLTIISAIPAVFVSFMVLKSVNNSKNVGRVTLFKDSLLMGSGIGVMHYLGMSAMHMSGIMRYDLGLIILSFIVAIIMAGISLSTTHWAVKRVAAGTVFSVKLLVAAIVMGIAVSGMHYIGMAAMYVFPGSGSSVDSMAWTPGILSKIVGFVAMSILVMLIGVIEFSRRLELYQRIKDSENRQRVILETAADGIIAIDENSLITTFNHAAETIFGYKFEEIVGQNVAILLPEHEQQIHRNYTKNSSLHASRIINQTRSIEGLRSDGSVFPIELAVSPMESNGTRGFVGVLRDITKRKRAEEKLLLAKEQAESASRAKTEFLSSMSHELRTPMNAIIGFGQLLQLEPDELSEPQRENVDEILKAGYHLLGMINDVLNLAKIESGKMELNTTVFPVSELIQQSMALIATQAKDRQIEFIDNLSSKGYMVSADFIRLKQVMVNLLSNAVKYNCEQGRVILGGEIDDQSIRLSVTDTGTGLAEEDIHNLYTPFERFDAINNVDGAGIGLTIAKHLIELMGGSIGVKSVRGEGSTFWLELARVNKT